ncbi:hypothetical protein ABZ816_40890 [Actinosynnema sp. NPDC047251]|uniref:Secreted protein n=1 Tax=Saccharothrix espanaensis (strain ATCC 51144 / DSM 44229 / JCM 9112 / NBRC 15066 / NRRL 15764) TaxID=1179773 RepID=K0KDE4_SACES|nr:hypothetical protein [Saccharothrix espanaensis]CCH34558.1 hypothetical protein BN6_73260 [Saccharothrix espanaensis DSM 44229]
MPRLVAVLCALLLVSACAGTDLAKHKPYPRHTVQAAAENVTETTGPQPTNVPDGQPVDPAFAADKLRLIDPCKLLDRKLLETLGTPGEVSATGFSRCSNFMKDKNGKDLAVTVEIGQTMTTELKNADKQLAGLKSYEQTLDTSACFVSVITQEKPALGLTVQIGYKEGDACAPGRKVAESVVKLLKDRVGVKSPPKDSLVTLDPCALVDKAAVEAAVGADNRIYPYGLHNCSWVANGKEITLDMRSTFVPADRKFDAKQVEVDLGGTTGYQLENSGAYPSCSVKWVQRLNTGEEGEIVEVKAAGPKKSEFDRCAMAVAFAKAVLPKVPKG